MGRVLRALAALLLGLGAGAVLVVGVASPASACSCVVAAASQPAEADALLAEADAVFTGRLVGRRDPISFLGVSGSGDLATLTFAVSEVYKGDVAPRQQVRTAQSGASCGLELSGEGPFLLFAHRDPGSGGVLFASLCGGATAQVDLATWPGAPPDAAVDGSPGPQPPSVAGVAATAVAVVALTGGLLVVLLRRGRRRRPG